MSYINGSIIELKDSSTREIDASFLSIATNLGRDPNPRLANLGHQFKKANVGVLHEFGVECDISFSEKQVVLKLTSGTNVGAIPLVSPSTGKAEIGLIVQPRFGWSGVGSVLAVAGWKIVPQLLNLPLLPKSEKKIPSWVLSLTLLPRIEQLLKQLQRKFSFTYEDTSSPKGQVNWTDYAVKRVVKFHMLQVPCRYPTLKYNEELKSAIHYTLKKHLHSLQNQVAGGSVVLRLIQYCQTLIQQVAEYPASRPSHLLFDRWQKTPMQTKFFKEGLQAIQWTTEERGLAGLGELEGIPWQMPMEQFFESWLETLAHKISLLIGGILKTGRLRQTIAPLSWQPAFAGSQKYLVPDLVIEKEDQVIILDAKYKYHWEEIRRVPWGTIEENLKEQHRNDLLQVLAYSTLFEGKSITTCIVYPCNLSTWESLRKRCRLCHKATLGTGTRQIDLVLTAVPIVGNYDEIISELVPIFRT
jgi:hypothetical protein